MFKAKMMVVLAAAVFCAPATLVADTDDSRAYDVGMIYEGNVGNQRLLKLPVFRPEHLRTLQLQDDGDVGASGPASGVEYFEVYAVGSSYIGWEYVSASQLSTIYNHGGSQLRVAVLQYGYGNGGATLNGSQGDHYATEYLCGSLSNLHYCNVGETITGFMEYYAFDGSQGGSFSAYTNSVASPWGQWTDTIYIQ